MDLKFSVDQVIEAVRHNRGILTLAARELGCTRQTIHNYANRYATIASEVTSQRESFLDLAETKLIEQVQNGNITAIIFTLKTIGKSRGYVERTEMTGSDGSPLLSTATRVVTIVKTYPDGYTPPESQPENEDE